MTETNPPAVPMGPAMVAPFREVIHNISRFGDDWSWRCGVQWTRASEGWTSGACRYDHVVDSWDKLVEQATAHLAKWHGIAPADAVRLVPDTDPDSVVGGLADGAIRYCDWPGCMDRVDTINGPVANGWRQTRRLLLCPGHSVREHWADYFKTEDGADVAGVWCTCGHRWNERPVNLNVLRAWWQQHVGTLGTEPSGDTVQAPPAEIAGWDGAA